VWEGDDGWIVVVIEADEPTEFCPFLLVHTIRTIIAPEGIAPANCPTTVAEDLKRGGMPQAGWKRLF
jgi:hypothetical protein